MTRSRVVLIVIVVSACLVLSSCLGKGLKFDAERLQRKCGLTGETELTLDDARCVAKVAGLKEGRKCPFEIDESVPEERRPVYAVRESCSGIEIRIDKSSGEIVDVEFGE